MLLFFVTQQVYPKLSRYEQQQCQEAVCLWFAKFKQKYPEYATKLEHLNKNLACIHLNNNTFQSWLSLSPDVDIRTMDSMFVCHVCGREFYTKNYYLSHQDLLIVC